MTSLTCESCDRRVSPGRRIDGEKILPPDCCRFCGRPKTEVALHRVPVAYPHTSAGGSIRLTSVARAYGQ